MSSTDNRIVRMQFDNAQFKKGAADTQKSLADLNKAVDNVGKGKGLMDVSSQMGKVSVSASKMAIFTTTALATIANKITNVGINMAKSLTFDPIKQGFSEYESLLTKQNVIQNATGKSAGVVKAALNQLNTYSDKTIYSFGNMTDAIQKFVNAGVPLKTSVTTIKGIANAAAFAGASSEEANRAMYAFSQSMSLGFIQLQDWNQIENANMGTIKFKEELLKAGQAAGTLTKQGKGYVTSSGKFVSATKGWRDGLQEQWATTEVLNTALGKYADTNTKLGKKAFKSAQEVRTFSAFMDTLKESLGSGWASIFTSLIGNLGQSTKMWTGLSNAVGGVVGSFFKFASTTLKTWRSMGGFEKTIQGFKNLLSPISALLGAIGKAYREAFPSSGKGAGKGLYALSAGFEAITRPITLLADLISGTTPILTTFFRVIHIGGTILGSIVGKIVEFISSISGLGEIKAPSSGGFLDFVKKLGKAIADAVEDIDSLLRKGASLSQAFGSVDIKLPKMPSMPSMPAMPSMSGIAGGDTGGASAKVAGLTSGVKSLATQVLGLNDASKETEKTKMFGSSKLDTSKFDEFKSSVSDMVSSTKTAGGETQSMADKMGAAFSYILDKAKEFFKGFTVQDVMSSFNMAVLITMARSISKFLNTLSDGFKGFAGVGESITGVLGQAGNALKSFQTQARAKLILNIGLALLALAAALFILALIPADKIAQSLGMLGGAAAIMSASMWAMSKVIEKMDGAKAGVKMIGLSVAILALAGAMVLLATAFLIFNHVDTKSVVKGLVTMFVTMKLLQSMGQMAEGSYKNLFGAAAAISAVAVSMLILAAALLIFQAVKWESIGKAGAVLGGLTLAVGALALIPYAGIAKVGLALLSASVGILLMANALIIFGLVKWESIAKAGVVLLILTASLAALMVVGNPVNIAGMVAMAGAMVLLAAAGVILNKVEWESIGKIAVIMLVLIAAFTIFLAVITAFAPALVLMSMFAGSLALLAFAITALALAFAIVFPLMAAGTAAFAAFATGAAVAIAVFLQTLASEAPLMKDSILKILQAAVDAIVGAVPIIIQGIKDLWAALKKEFTSKDKGKSFGDTAKAWMTKLGDKIKEWTPKLALLGVALIVGFLKAVGSKASQLASAGVDLVVKLINGISRKLGDIQQAAVNLIVKFAAGIGNQLITIVNAGINLIGSFLHRLATAIRGSSGVIGGGLSDVIDAMGDVGVDMVQGLIGGVGSMVTNAIGSVTDMAHDMVNAAKNIFKEHSPSKVFYDIGKFVALGLSIGIQNYAAVAIKSTAAMLSGQIALSVDMINGFINTLEQRSIAARAKADGLTAAAKRAEKAANATKTRTDDAAAGRISRQAKTARNQAAAAEKRVKSEKAAQARQRKWDNASSLERAKIRADDAKNQIAAAKAKETDAAAERIQAQNLVKMSRAKGLAPAQRAKLLKEAKALRAKSLKDAKSANANLKNAQASAASAMVWQERAGKEAAEDYQTRYEEEARLDAEADAFEKMSATEKAAKRREEAAALQKKADADLAAAKKLAYTNVAKANELADKAIDEANRARDLLAEATSYDGGVPTGGAPGQAISLTPSDLAAQAFNQYSDLYSGALAAAAATPSVEFTQINNSPESLSPSEIYRQTNNLVTYAAGRLNPQPV